MSTKQSVDLAETQPLMGKGGTSGSGGGRDVSPRELKKKKERKWELSKAVEAIGNGRYQLVVGLICGLSQFTDGIQQLSVGFLLHYLGNLFKLTNHGKAMIGTVSGAGMLVGSVMWGRVADLYGRKVSLIGTLLQSGVFALLSAVSPWYELFLVFRFLSAAGVGGNVPLAFTIFTEFSAKEKRGFWNTLMEAFWSLGAVVACILAWAILPNGGDSAWCWYTVLCGAPAIILAAFCFWFMEETPRYYLVTGQVKKAEQVLEQMAIANKKPEFIGRKLVAVPDSTPPSFISSFAGLFSRNYIWSTIPLFAMYFMLAFGCGVFMWLPVLLEAKNLEVQSMYRSMVIMALSQIPGVIVSGYLVESVGRLWAIGSFFFLGSISMAVFAVSQLESVVVLTSVFMEFFLAGVNGSLSAYTVEVYPTSMRSTAMGACSALSRLSSVINPTIWASLLNISVAAAVFSGAAGLLIAFGLLFLLPQESTDHEIKDFEEKKDK